MSAIAALIPLAATLALTSQPLSPDDSPQRGAPAQLGEHRPRFVRTPSGDEFEAAYPPEAARRGISGTATMRCAINISGRLEACEILAEEPKGQGFGQATLVLARYFEIVDPSPSAAITIPIHFNLGR